VSAATLQSPHPISVPCCHSNQTPAAARRERTSPTKPRLLDLVYHSPIQWLHMRIDHQIRGFVISGQPGSLIFGLISKRSDKSSKRYVCSFQNPIIHVALAKAVHSRSVHLRASPVLPAYNLGWLDKRWISTSVSFMMVGLEMVPRPSAVVFEAKLATLSNVGLQHPSIWCFAVTTGFGSKFADLQTPAESKFSPSRLPLAEQIIQENLNYRWFSYTRWVLRDESLVMQWGNSFFDSFSHDETTCPITVWTSMIHTQ